MSTHLLPPQSSSAKQKKQTSDTKQVLTDRLRFGVCMVNVWCQYDVMPGSHGFPSVCSRSPQQRWIWFRGTGPRPCNCRTWARSQIRAFRSECSTRTRLRPSRTRPGGCRPRSMRSTGHMPHTKPGRTSWVKAKKDTTAERKAWLIFAKMYKDKPQSFWANVLWTHQTKI